MMNTPFQRITGLAMSALALASVFITAQAIAQPAQRPLLTNQSGAKPNLMIALDNSGSMAFPFHEAYNILFNDNNNHPLAYCTGGRQALEPSGTWVQNGMVDFNRPVNQRCANAAITVWTNDNGTAYVPPSPPAPAGTPAVVIQNAWNAQRSADLNPVYYDPRTTYAARVGPDYQALTRPATIQFVSNQGGYTSAAGNFYRVYRDPATGDLYTTNVQKPNGTLYRVSNNLAQAKTVVQAAPAWATNANVVYSLTWPTPFPTHLEYNATNALTPSFQYAFCRDATGASTVQKDRNNQDIGCASVRNPPYLTSPAGSVTTVLAPGNPGAAANIIRLPPDNKRTDCGIAPAATCTNAQEINNILNWYHWYSTRVLATSTAIGQSLAGDNIQGKIRIGYMPINDLTLNTNLSDIRINLTPGTNTTTPDLLRGVRPLVTDTTSPTVDSQRLYRFLNSTVARGGTPLHNAVSQVARYYGVPNGASENPWSTDASQLSSAGNPEMSCRRSFNLLFSDGSWTQSYAPNPVGPDYDNINGPTFSQLQPDGSTKSYRYLRLGDDTVAGRSRYTPYPSASRGGLADLTAQYFWHTDLRPGLDNSILTRPGQPTFWQNMTTYTVGYFIRPTGDVTNNAADLSFANINTFKTQYARTGYAAATKPAWPTSNLISTGNTQALVDDFVQAGYTGGGRAFSASSAEDVRSIFNTIVAEILSASGTDAGVSVSGGGASDATLSANAKFAVSYTTLDNSGDIFARELDPNTGVETGNVAWTASTQMPSPSARRVFTMSGVNTPVDFLGRFDGLPADVRNTIRQGPDAARVPNDASFVDYLRGDDLALDTSGNLFRQRTSRIAAMVNPPSVLMGGGLDYVYDQDASGGVEGRGSYGNYVGRKKLYPASLFVATNAGTMHAIDSSITALTPSATQPFTTTPGVEQAGFMPRRSLSHMLNFAKEPYNFEYVLDGPISENDIFDRSIVPALPNDEWKAWRQLGVGTGGRGEKLIYAINSPIKPGAAPNRIPDRADFRWETGPDRIDIADGQDVTMGHIANSARSGQTQDLGNTLDTRGRWIVAVNNGHYNGVANGEETGLVVLDALTGEVIRTIPIPVVAGQPPNRGLSGVTLVRDYASNTRVTAAYAGDANGNIWRFTLMGDPSTWEVTYGAPLFTTPNNRPIFGHPAWQGKTLGTVNDGYMVVFATGMALEENDLADLGAQSIYGIWDRTDVYGGRVGVTPFSTLQESDLLLQSVLPGSRVGNLFSVTDNQIDWNTHSGWRMPLGWLNGQSQGERNIADVQNIGPKVLITTTELHPASDAEMCSISDLPGNFIYVLDARTGAQGLSRSFDENGDGALDAFAVAYRPAGGFSRGVSVTRRRTTLNGTLLPVDSPTISGGLTDPVAEQSSDRRGAGFEAQGESALGTTKADGKCANLRGTILGTAEDAVEFGVECPVTSWTRTQFQLSAPPSN
jgi:type IV pilus assembly protein PilY1